MLVTSYSIPSTYDRVHMVTGHPGLHGMNWHRQHSINAAYSSHDAAAPRPVCTACVYGSMHQTNTNHRREHRPQPTLPGQQFVLDANTNSSRSYRYFKYCDLLTDQATGQIYNIFTTNRSAAELCDRIAVFFDMHPAWLTNTSPDTPRYIRVDPENNYKSELFLRLMAQCNYYNVHSPTRDKHAQGIAERSVGVIATKTNIAMMAPTPNVPPKYWCLAMSYACITHSFNYSTRINDSPYHFTTGHHININSLHPFWARVYVHIPLKDRKGKVGHRRAYQGHFVGYLFTSTVFDNFIILDVLENGHYGIIRHSKDVIFDTSINFLRPDPNTEVMKISFLLSLYLFHLIRILNLTKLLFLILLFPLSLTPLTLFQQLPSRFSMNRLLLCSTSLTIRIHISMRPTI